MHRLSHCCPPPRLSWPRCVRADEVSTTVRCHYMTTGKVVFTFSVGRRELFLPAPVLLKCFLDASDRELFHYLVDCSPTVRLMLAVCALPPTQHAYKQLELERGSR